MGHKSTSRTRTQPEDSLRGAREVEHDVSQQARIADNVQNVEQKRPFRNGGRLGATAVVLEVN